MRAAPVGRQRDVRTNLRWWPAGRRTGCSRRPRRRWPGSGEVPYTDAEIDAYLGWPTPQPTVGRRMRPAALVCLGRGGCSGPICAMSGAGTSPERWRDGLAVDGPERGWCPSWPAIRTGSARPPFRRVGYLIGGRSPHRHISPTV